MYKHLLLPTDGSKLSDKAVAHGIALAKALGARVTMFYASPDYPTPIYSEGVVFDPMSKREYAKHVAEDARRLLDRAAAKAKTAGVECKTAHVIAAAPWKAIIAAAKKSKCDAIVMASHGRRGISALLIGSETTKVLTHGKLPVVVVR
jgi:nucleotide-binding universal stress UspA family protein